MRFDKLTQSIAAGASWRLGMAARELLIVSSSYALRVTLYKGGAVVGYGENVLAGDYFRGVDFDAVDLFSADSQDVTVMLTDGESGSSRIVGEVSVINGELSRVKANKAFLGVAFSGASLGNYSHVQIWNPPGSGKLVVLSKADVFAPASATAFEASFARHAAALVNSTTVGNSKYLGGAAPVAQMRSAALAAFVGDQLGSIAVPSAASEYFDFSEPFAIPEGYGVLVRSHVVNENLASTFQWTEESI